MFKIKITLAFLFISLFSNAQSLSGVYQIGTASPNPFKTLPSAIDHLESRGVSGAVTFLLNDATYTLSSALVITPIAGSSAQNTITIKPNVGKNVLIKTQTINNWTNIPAVIQIDGADNIIIDGSNTTNGNSRNLTLQNDNPTDYLQQSVVWLASVTSNGVSNFEIKNTKLTFVTRTMVSKPQMGVFVGSNVLDGNMATAVHSNIKISNNKFENVREAITVKGSNTTALRSEKFTIAANEVVSASSTEKANSGFRISNVDGFTISNNLIAGLENPRNDEFSDAGIRIENSTNYIVTNNIIKDISAVVDYVSVYGVYVSGLSNNGKISENTITNVKSMKNFSIAIFVDVNSANASNTIIANNMISDVATDGAWSKYASGIEIANGKNIKIYHNSVLLSGAPFAHNSHALRINQGTDFDVRNNMFININTLGSRYSIYSNVSAAAFTQLNNNNYFSTQYVGFANGNRTTLAHWKTATGKDANSLNIQPTFTSTTNLRLTAANVALDNKGTFIAAIPTDIDGQLRNTTTPDLGAAEFGVVICPTTTWNGTSWSNGSPDTSLKAIFAANYTATDHLNVCSITVTGTAVVTIPTGLTLNSGGDVIVEAAAKLILQSDADLLQPSTAVNTGAIIVKRSTSALMRLDYILWSSPVANQTLGSFSPQTAANRFYTYTSATDTYTIVSAPTTTLFAPATGYLVRTPNNHPAVPTVWEGTFTGAANNGDIQVTVAANKFAAVGNPYPSAISADQFIAANNLSSPIYFYRKTNGAATSAYATYTLAGGTATGTSGRHSNDAKPMVPNGIINVGQGFVVRSTTSQVSFDNSMRVATGSGEFLRAAAERNRIWLNLTGANDTFSQTLISYMNGASNDVDAGIDGLFYNDSATALTTIINAEEYAIQGRQLPFDTADVVALGFKTNSAGTFEISIDDLDGLFADDQQIYLVDNLTGITHDLKSASYSFTSEAGVFNQRFQIKFELMSLGTNPVVITGTDIKIKAANQSVSLIADDIISEVTIYDISGRVLAAVRNVNESALTLPVDAVQQVVIVRAISTEGLIITKKVML